MMPIFSPTEYYNSYLLCESIRQQQQPHHQQQHMQQPQQQQQHHHLNQNPHNHHSHHQQDLQQRRQLMHQSQQHLNGTILDQSEISSPDVNRPRSSSDGSAQKRPMTEEEKLKHKRERNRRAAANCRRRKEERIKQLQEENDHLQKIIRELQARLDTLEAANRSANSGNLGATITKSENGSNE